MTNVLSTVKPNKTQAAPAFGVLLLLKALQKALGDSNAIQSKILGNAIYISASRRFPANLDLMGLDYFRHITDEQKKQVAMELDKMKKPYYDSRVELQKFLAAHWVGDKIFEKNATSSTPKRAAPVKTGQRPQRKAATQKVAPKAAPVVIVKKKMI